MCISDKEMTQLDKVKKNGWMDGWMYTIGRDNRLKKYIYILISSLFKINLK